VITSSYHAPTACMDSFGDGNVPMNKASYHANRPPRCLAKLRSEPTKLNGLVFDGHSARWPNSVFRLRCLCGSRTHYLLGFLHSEPDPFNLPNAFGQFMESPLALRCAACNRPAELLDMQHHGYDGEMGNGCTDDHEARRSRLVCPSCGIRRFQVFPRFEYSPHLRKEVDEEWHGKEHDLFSWFTLVVECEGCGHRGVVADEECA
jgi:hypothetical protein